MHFDKLSLFADGTEVPKAANATTYSRVIELRKTAMPDPLLRIYAQVVGPVNASGSVTTKVQFSDDGFAWTDCVSFVQDGALLAQCIFPVTGQRRFVRLAFAVGSAGLGSDVRIKAGLVDQFDQTDLPAAQGFPPLEDLTGLGDRLAEPLALGAASGSIAKGASGTVKAVRGAFAGAEAPSGYTVTVSGDTATVALASSAATGKVKFVDGLGNRVEYSVTAT